MSASNRPPEHFDTNLAVIGAGSAGLVTAYVAAASGAKVSLIERARMGGDCLNTGCVPSKALLRSAAVAATIRRAAEFGLEVPPPRVDFAAVMERVQQVIRRIEPHDSVERYTSLGVDCIAGHARIRSPWSVDIDGRTLTARALVIATGAQPAIPPIPGLNELAYLSSDNLWDLRELPARLLVLGGGPIGCELAQAFARLGSKVTLVEMLPRLLLREDEEAARLVSDSLRADGVRVLTGHRAVAFQPESGGGRVELDSDTGRSSLSFDRVLVAVGRRPDTADLGLENAGIELHPNGTIKVDPWLRTTCPSVFACGDVAGPFQLTHAASHQAWYCAMNALFGSLKKFRVDYSVLPWVTFTDPELARVGLIEADAREQGIAVEVSRYDLDGLDRAIADGEARGFVKLVTKAGSDRLLGATIVGPHAGELIAEYVLAMRQRLGLRKILNTIHSYPTLAEANRSAAGEWQKQHLPGGLLKLARYWHRWRLG